MTRVIVILVLMLSTGVVLTGCGRVGTLERPAATGTVGSG